MLILGDQQDMKPPAKCALSFKLSLIDLLLKNWYSLHEQHTASPLQIPKYCGCLAK